MDGSQSRACLLCLQVFSVTDFGSLQDTSGAVGNTKYCPTCNEERRKKNRQIYPLCPMCSMPTRANSFLKSHQGYPLDIIRVCCSSCKSLFFSLSEDKRRALLEKAMITAYGETAYIYALHYDDSDAVHHIGRTKNLIRRLADYRKRLETTPFQHWSLLEEVTYGPLTMERETRWLLHALTYDWPIDNFELIENIVPEHRAEKRRRHAELKAALVATEPLTASFEIIQPFFRYFMGTTDVHFVHWFLEDQTKADEGQSE